MPKRITYKKSKKQKKSNNKTRYKKSKSHSKRIKAGDIIKDPAYPEEPPYQCDNGYIYKTPDRLTSRLSKTKPIPNVNINAGPSNNTIYTCVKNINPFKPSKYNLYQYQYEDKKLIGDDTKIPNKKYYCSKYGDVMEKPSPVTDKRGYGVRLFIDGSKKYECKNNDLYINGNPQPKQSK